jgi:hypothetical protein
LAPSRLSRIFIQYRGDRYTGKKNSRSPMTGARTAESNRHGTNGNEKEERGERKGGKE